MYYLDSKATTPMSNYKELKVWQLAMDLVLDIYLLTKDFPKDERFSLVSQMRRASVSSILPLHQATIDLCFHPLLPLFLLPSFNRFYLLFNIKRFFVEIPMV